MLELNKIIRAWHLVVCPIVFILFYERNWSRGVLRFMKNNYFLVFSAVFKFLGKVRSALYYNCMK